MEKLKDRLFWLILGMSLIILMVISYYIGFNRGYDLGVEMILSIQSII